jgi:hypothetical protein
MQALMQRLHCRAQAAQASMQVGNVVPFMGNPFDKGMGIGEEFGAKLRGLLHS